MPMLTDLQREAIQALEKENKLWRPIPIYDQRDPDELIGIIIRGLDFDHSIYTAHKLASRIGWNCSVRPIIWYDDDDDVSLIYNNIDSYLGCLPIQGDGKLGVLVSKRLALERCIENAYEASKAIHQAWRLEVIVWCYS